MRKSEFLKSIDIVAHTLLGTFCFLYSIFKADFAEQCLRLSFLDFPIFVGEILLFVCLVLLIMKVIADPPAWHAGHFVLGAYFIWVVVRALTGYLAGGPLALRHAALFYYPLFAIFGFYFFRKDYFDQKRSAALIMILALTLALKPASDYFLIPGYILLILLAINLGSEKLKYASAVMIALGTAFKFRLFFLSGRSHMIGLAGIFLFLVVFFILYAGRFRLRYKLGFIGVSLIIFLSGIFFLSDRNAVKSLLTPSVVMDQFEKLDAYINDQKREFRFAELSAAIYHDNFSDIRKETKPGKLQKRNLAIAYNNILFRVFIWRDMVKEIFNEKAWMGLSFGKPQRSISMEILRWAPEEWERDGWITPHNSYLHIIYRAGILGILMVLCIAWIFVSLVKDFIRQKSITGGLLCGVILYWLLIANFLVFLELPYNAIPFWTLFGMTLAYRQSLSARKIS